MNELNLTIPDLTDEDLLREMDHEQAMLDEGIARFEQRVVKERNRGQLSASGGGKVVVASMTAKIADLVVEEIARLESGRVKRKPPELRTLKLLPARVLALITLSSTLDCLGMDKEGRKTTQHIAWRIGNAISAEAMARDFRKEERPLFEAVVRRIKSRNGSPSQRMQEIVKVYKTLDEKADPMTTQEKVRLGTFLLTFAEAVGVVESHTLPSAGRRLTKVFEITPQVLEIIANTDNAMAEMQPHLLPTLITPRPWTSLRSGGYWMSFRGCNMIVAKNRSNGIRSAQDVDMPRMFTPVNYLQSVPYRINPKVLDVIKRMRESNITCSSLPPSQLEGVPPKPHDIESNEEARAAWRVEARGVHTRNATVKGRVLAASKTISVADSLKDEENIFFPKVVDFRGRVYDLPMFLKPQGDDLSKGLLEFANGKPLGPDGGYWLAVHGANVWGEDKVSLDDRVQWVLQNEARIIRAGEEPFEERFWMDADKPFQFLAFCVEWAGAREYGDDYVSRLPVALDGSCNGLQHLSAILRDSVGGAAVNLMPAEKPQDIYTEVMVKVIDVLKLKAETGEPTAQKWLPLIQRKTVKRPVMTLPYGATRQGFADQIMEDTIRPLEKAGESPFPESYAAAKYLGEIVWEATGSVVIAAREAMDWLQEVAKVASKSGKEIRWTTPSGFVVKQDYRDLKTRAVELSCLGQRVQLQVAAGHSDKINKRKMAMAIAPNFVHSMDAAHMLRTVELLLELVGPSIHLSMVHDSYATHAADAEVLSLAIRQAFVQMYNEKCWLTSFRDEVAEQIGPELAEKLPLIPEAGDLQLAEVLNSLYFFA